MNFTRKTNEDGSENLKYVDLLEEDKPNLQFIINEK